MTTIALAGNPNCGKTTLFNDLTGARQRVGNWPGVTVERKTGAYRRQGGEVRVQDLPGVYALDGPDEALDERIARQYLAAGEADVVVNVIDASSIGRGLYLTLELLESHPLVVALNMMDAAQRDGLQIDVGVLSQKLGCPVVPLVASRGEGVAELMDAAETVARSPGGATAQPWPRTPEARYQAIDGLLQACLSEAPSAGAPPGLGSDAWGLNLRLGKRGPPRSPHRCPSMRWCCIAISPSPSFLASCT